MLYDKSTGVLKWHRTWNLPSISVLVSLGEENQIPSGLNVRLFAVKLKILAQSKEEFKNQQPIFENIGLTGQDSIPLNDDGLAIISGMKLKSTSFNHENQLFYLVAIVYVDLGDSTADNGFDTEVNLTD